MQAYTVLSNEATRELYDIDLNESKMEEEMGFTNEPISEWLPMTDPTKARNTNPGETRAIFVDEVPLPAPCRRSTLSSVPHSIHAIPSGRWPCLSLSLPGCGGSSGLGCLVFSIFLPITAPWCRRRSWLRQPELRSSH